MRKIVRGSGVMLMSGCPKYGRCGPLRYGAYVVWYGGFKKLRRHDGIGVYRSA